MARFFPQLGIVREGSDVAFTPDQLTVNRYNPGEGIPPHVDTHSAFTHIIASLSLGSTTVMTFRRQKTTNLSAIDEARACPRPGKAITPRKQDTDAVVSIPLPPRSLAILKGEARYAWSHAIAARKKDCIDDRLVARGVRVSLTFRRLRPSQLCDCDWPSICDAHVSMNNG